MRVQYITITGLFGMFDHRIPLFPSEPITIIHGPNGIGKTSILRLIYGTLKPDLSHLRQVPFGEIEIQFQNDTALAASPSKQKDVVEEAPDRSAGRRVRQRAIHFRLKKCGRVEDECDMRQAEPPPPIPGRIDAVLPMLHRIGPREWHDTIREETLSFEEVIHLYGDELPDEFRTHGEPEWLRDIQSETPIHFIETQRLLDVRHPSPFHGRHQPSESAVKRCSDDLASRIKSKLAEYATLSQSLERTFPARLIGTEEPSPLTEAQIRDELTRIDEHRSRLVEAGLLDRGFEPPLPSKEFDETTKRVLTVYIHDTQEKLAVLDNFLSRVELMKSIVNSRFLYKTLSVNREQGFVVTTREGRRISLGDLSSGEQHELVLLYELLFRARETLPAQRGRPLVIAYDDGVRRASRRAAEKPHTCQREPQACMVLESEEPRINSVQQRPSSKAPRILRAIQTSRRCTHQFNPRHRARVVIAKFKIARLDLPYFDAKSRLRSVHLNL